MIERNLLVTLVPIKIENHYSVKGIRAEVSRCLFFFSVSQINKHQIHLKVSLVFCKVFNLQFIFERKDESGK